jgi:hypothetical protein
MLSVLLTSQGVVLVPLASPLPNDQLSFQVREKKGRLEVRSVTEIESLVDAIDRLHYIVILLLNSWNTPQKQPDSSEHGLWYGTVRNCADFKNKLMRVMVYF